MLAIDAVDFFYLSMPRVEDIGDGSQDALLVRVTAGDETGWGECEAAPLVSIASFVCPLSHSACHPLADSVLGQALNDPADIARIGALVRARSQDVLQADHTFAGIDMALWDLMGKRLGEPVWKLLGFKSAAPKLPYASRLFGDTAAETLAKAREVRELGYRAVKFGWGSFGAGSVAADIDQVHAAREGLGADGVLLIDAGTIWVEDVERASCVLPALNDVAATWLEEPFVTGALGAYAALAGRSGAVKLAGGEGSHNLYMAKQMIDDAKISFVQIDAGRVGISISKEIADYAHARGVTYVNHTFTSNLALSASLQPYVGYADATLCEYPVDIKQVARAITVDSILPGSDGMIRVPDGPGLGVTVDPSRWAPYLQDVEIKVGGRMLYRTPGLT